MKMTGYWLLLLLVRCAEGVYTIEFNVQPAGSVAGLTFEAQPAMKILDDNGDLADTFVGFMRAEMISSPSGTELLFYTNGTSSSSDPEMNRVAIDDGLAKFSGLFINLVGEGFGIRIIAEDADFAEFAFADSIEFAVVTGAPSRLLLQGFPSGGLGGSVFAVQPLLYIVDVGGNLVEDANVGEITVKVMDTAEYPNPTGQQLLPAERKTQVITNGACQFVGLYMDGASSGYWLNFTATGIDLEFMTVLMPYSITIYVGPPSAMEFLRPATSTCLGGEPFDEQPKLRVRDAGGNTLVGDSTSMVVANIQINPTGTALICDDCAYVFADRGVATFANLGLETVGKRYIMRYTLWTYSTITDSHTALLYLDSERFDVVEGDPTSIFLVRNSYRGAAKGGGSAFPQQPEILLYDRGGNVVIADSSSTVRAGIVASISNEYFGAEINTEDEPAPRVLRLSAGFSHETTPTLPGEPGALFDRPTLAAGDVFKIALVFDADVFMPADAYIELNTYNGSSFSRAMLDIPGVFASEHGFTYVVRPDESTPAVDARSLYSSRQVVDPFGRVANTTLPVGLNVTGSLANTTSVAVSQMEPKIANVSTSTVKGEYTTGQLLQFNVTYDAIVQVVIEPSTQFYTSVVPYLPLALNGSSSTTSYATYVSGSGTSMLLFEYTLARNQDSDGEPLEIYDGENNSTFLKNLTANDAVIYRRAATPTTLASLAIPHSASKTVASAEVTVSARAPLVNATYGVRVLSEGNATYYAGDVLRIAVGFDTEVEVSLRRVPLLYLDTGLGVPVAAAYESGGGTKILMFSYEVSADDSIGQLEVSDDDALQNAGSGWTRRSSTVPSVAAVLSLLECREVGSLIANYSRVALDGVSPVITKYGITSAVGTDRNNHTAILDDVVEVTLEFDKPVVVFGVPLIRLDPGAITRNAVYQSGNGTRFLRFEYIVQLGDTTEALALQMDSLREIRDGSSTTVVTGNIMLASSKPVVAADLRLYIATGGTSSLTLGAALARPPGLNVLSGYDASNASQIMALTSRPTVVTYVDFASGLEDYPDVSSSASYGVGQLVALAVGFSDEVPLTGEPPVLQLSTGSQAIYLGGEGTAEWYFLYEVVKDDLTVDNLNVDDVNNWVSTGSINLESALWCNVSVGCDVLDRLGHPVNLTMNLTDPVFTLRTGVEIDISAPYILDVWCRSLASTYDTGYGLYAAGSPWFTVGERLEFAVEFSKSVRLLSPEGPRIEFDLGPSATFPFAVFEEVETDTRLRFAYTVRAGDMTTNLTLLAFTDNLGQAELFHESTQPTTAVNYTLPTQRKNRPIPANGTNDPLEIHTTRVPEVVNVSFAGDSLKRLAPGDQITVEVFFSASVSVSGAPFIWLSASKETSVASYESGSGTAKLLFAYEVGLSEHHALLLDYKGVDALRLGSVVGSLNSDTNFLNQGTILATATDPTQKALLELPSVKNASLATYGVVVDGMIPRLIHIRPDISTTPTGLIWHRGQTLAFEMVFSAAVAVFGQPRIRLETGVVDRRAHYVNGSNSTILRFEYVVQAGDSTSSLDYFSDLDNFRNSLAALELPEGAWIRRFSQRPILEADSNLNPIRAELASASGLDYSGDPFEAKAGAPRGVVAGSAKYLDLAMMLHAQGLTVRFYLDREDMYGVTLSDGVTFEVEYTVDVALRVGDGLIFDAANAATDKYPERFGGIPQTVRFSHLEGTGDLFGWAVGAEAAGGIVVVGAPGKARPTSEVQLVTIEGATLTPTTEIQSFQVGVLRQPAVQSFITDSDPFAIIGGSFLLQYRNEDGDLVGDSALIPVTSDPDILSQLLLEAYPDFESVTASREEYTFCACVNGYKWTVTFVGLHGTPLVGELVLDSTPMTGAGAKISTVVTRVLETSYVNGTWHLELPESSRTSSTTNFSRPISVRADSAEIVAAVGDFNFDVENVDFFNTDDWGGRRWAVTFAEFGRVGKRLNDIPQLEPTSDPSLLTSGPGANAFGSTVRNGTSPVWGGFRLGWRDSVELTESISYNASAAEVKTALEGLQSIDEVLVSKHVYLISARSTTWRVTFKSINQVDRAGDWGPVPMGDLEKIFGDPSSLEGTDVTLRVDKYDNVPPWMGARAGSRGSRAGAAYVYERSPISAADDTLLWAPEFALVPDESDSRGESMMFGHSVDTATAYGKQYTVVGAPYAEDHGFSEIQNLTCVASRGQFRLQLLGFHSDWISANATVEEAQEAIQGKYGDLSAMHPLPKLTFTALHTHICRDGNQANRTATLLIEFDTPPSGPGDITTPANIDLLQVESELGSGYAAVGRIRRGTRQPHGIGALGAACGAAFIYERTLIDKNQDAGVYPTKAWWRQVARLISGTSCREGDRLGWSVALDAFTGTSVVGAPGAGVEYAGRVMLFSTGGKEQTKDSEGTDMKQAVDSTSFGAEEGDEFGFDIAMSPGSDGTVTLLVGAPGDDNMMGAVYVYISPSAYDVQTVGGFLITQRLDASDPEVLATGTRSAFDRFGCSVSLDYDYLAIGVCGASDVVLGGARIDPADADSEDRPLMDQVGAVLVYKRESPSHPFLFVQRLEPSNVKALDRFGTAVSIQNGTIVASSLKRLRKVGLREPIDAPLGPRHAVFTVETVFPNDGTLGFGGTFKLGWRSTNVTEVEELCGDSTRRWYDIDSRSAHCAEIVTAAGGSLAAERVRWSRPLSTRSTALQVEVALEEDLSTGQVGVSRSRADAITGAFYWNVTFRGLDDEDLETAADMLLRVDGDGLVGFFDGGAAPEMKVTMRNEMPKRIRGLGRVFILKSDDDTGGLFVEQSLLAPYAPQRQDLFGAAAALDGDLVVIGAPNTDTEESRVNAGAVRAYDLSFVSLQFEETRVNTTEGRTARCVLKRRDPSAYTGVADGLAGKRLTAFVATLARNAEREVQGFFKKLYGLHGARSIPAGKTAIDMLDAGTAHARASYYGGPSNSSAWVDGGRDDEGVSDYVPVGDSILLPPDVNALAFELQTTDDDLLERPDETLQLVLWMPGMFASQLGDQRCEITILDDGDGLDGTSASAYEAIGAPLEEDDDSHLNAKPFTLEPLEFTGAGIQLSAGAMPAAGAAQGTSMATLVDERDEEADFDADPLKQAVFCFLGAPSANSSVGLVRVHKRANGHWSLMQTLSPPESTDNSTYLLPGGTVEYGFAVAAGNVYGRDQSTLLIGAPGVPAVYVYELDRNLTLFTLRQVFTQKTEATRRDDQFGAAVALSADVACVGAPGLETVYVYRRVWDTQGEAWLWGSVEEQKVRSFEYDYDVLRGGAVFAVHEQGFGSSVSIHRNTLAVGAPFADYGNLGRIDDAEAFETDGVDNRRLGKGKAFVFYSVPPQLVVTVRADSFLFNGSFTLRLDSYRNQSCETTRLAFGAQAEDVRLALDAACFGVLSGEIEVTRDHIPVATDNGGEKLAWTVTFLGEAENPPLKSAWRFNGCGNCLEFNADWSPNSEKQVLVEPRERGDDAPPGGGARSGSDYASSDKVFWVQQASLQAYDRVPNAAFGRSIAVDGDFVLVGAPRAPGAAATTWDFETGDLSGWRRTGDAFDYQPTFGDGPSYREDAENTFAFDSRGPQPGGRPRSARVRGRYFVGTAEKRPGGRFDSSSNAGGRFDEPQAGTSEGASVGDAPTGTLTSEPLHIPLKSVVADEHGLTVSFLVGGGCDPLRVYVELLIDGAAVERATGRCDERMRNVTFVLNDYEGRSLVMRIVDASKSRWGHINVDHFTFSWPHRSSGAGTVEGASVVDSFFTEEDLAANKAGSAKLATSTGAPSSHGRSVHRSGGAYAYRRKANSTVASCAGDKELCAWEYMTRLLPSDRGPLDAFGSSVALDVSTPQSFVALVGAPRATAKTHWKLRPPKRPAGGGPDRSKPGSFAAYYYDLTNTVYLRESAAAAGADLSNEDANRFTPVQLPMDPSLSHGEMRQKGVGAATLAASAARGVWAQLARDVALGVEHVIPQSPALDEAKEAGAFYVFELQAELFDELTGETTTPPRWSALELARLRGVGGFARDHLGTAVAVAGRTLFATAPGSDAFGTNQGAAFAFDRDVLRVRFLEKEFFIVEGVTTHATITLVRDEEYAATAVTVYYATEDLTAKGVDDLKYATCYSDEDPGTRYGCGDYMQTRGTAHFAAGQLLAYFFVPVIDDDCYEPYLEYVQLTLSVPGAPVAVGENFMAKLRIDDDDYDSAACADDFI